MLRRSFVGLASVFPFSLVMAKPKKEDVTRLTLQFIVEDYWEWLDGEGDSEFKFSLWPIMLGGAIQHVTRLSMPRYVPDLAQTMCKRVSENRVRIERLMEEDGVDLDKPMARADKRTAREFLDWCDEVAKCSNSAP